MSNSWTAPPTPTLRGIILRDDDDKVIVQATPSEVRTFATQHRGQQVAVQPTTGYMRASFAVRNPPPTTIEEMSGHADAILDPYGLLYNAEGKPVAQIREWQVSVDQLDVTSFSDTRQFLMGVGQRVQIGVEVLPGVRLLR